MYTIENNTDSKSNKKSKLNKYRDESEYKHINKLKILEHQKIGSFINTVRLILTTKITKAVRFRHLICRLFMRISFRATF